MQKFIILVSSAVLLFLSGCFVITVNLTPEDRPLQEQVIAGAGKDKIVLMDITGVITTEESGSLVGGRERGMVAVVREQLDRVRKDKNVKALVVRINSPGGGVTASDMLYHEIRRFRTETGVKVLAHFTETGASGAYYAALAADRISAQPTTITGSIGVIMLRIDASGLMQKIGIEALHIASGPQKGMGSPFRAVSAGEIKIFQNIIDKLHRRFVDIIVAERNVDRERAEKTADGRVYTSREAKDAGLIDDIGYLDDAFEQARRMANIEQATIVSYVKPGEYRPNIHSLNLVNVNLGDLAAPGVQFTYLWVP